MKIAVISSPDKGRSDQVIAALADSVQAIGLLPAGVVQTNTQRAARFHCDMDLKVLPAGPTFCISQDLGTGAHGCRLDPEALEMAVAKVSASLASGQVDVLILNKFGKHEAEGRGFRGLIGEAVAQGIPVVLAVNAANRTAFSAFAEGLAIDLPADPAVILNWIAAYQSQAA